ncbi:MAG: rubredoxin-like domain-containing protein [Desulfobacterales bacterium]
MDEKTTDNLALAFVKTSVAAERHRVWAMKARAEGRSGAARRFEASAASASIQAKRCMRLLRGRIGNTDENIQCAVEGLFPKMARHFCCYLTEARDGDSKVAEEVFSHCLEVTLGTRVLLSGLDSPAPEDTVGPLFVCQVCGWIETGAAPERCPVCNAVEVKFEPVAG